MRSELPQLDKHTIFTYTLSTWTDRPEKTLETQIRHCRMWHLGPVVQGIVSLTSSLRVISLTVLADSIYNILIFFAEKM